MAPDINSKNIFNHVNPQSPSQSHPTIVQSPVSASSQVDEIKSAMETTHSMMVSGFNHLDQRIVTGKDEAVNKFEAIVEKMHEFLLNDYARYRPAPQILETMAYDVSALRLGQANDSQSYQGLAASYQALAEDTQVVAAGETFKRSVQDFKSALKKEHETLIASRREQNQWLENLDRRHQRMAEDQETFQKDMMDRMERFETTQAAKLQTILDALQTAQASSTPANTKTNALQSPPEGPSTKSLAPSSKLNPLDGISIRVHVRIALSSGIYDGHGPFIKNLEVLVQAEQCKSLARLDAKVSGKVVPDMLKELKFDDSDLKTHRRASKLTLYDEDSDTVGLRGFTLTKIEDPVYHAWYVRNVSADKPEARARFEMTIIGSDDTAELEEARVAGMSVLQGIERQQNTRARYFLVK